MKIGFVFGAGGALGAAHVGVLKRLLEANIKPDIIVGTSAGAIVGGLYAAGLPLDEFDNIIKNREFELSLMDLPKVNEKYLGLIEGEKLLKLLSKLTYGKNFEDLPIKVAFNAFDIEKEEEVILNRGSLAEAMRASASIPTVFRPFKIGNRYLVDGAVADPLPVKIAKDLGADFVIAVSFIKKYYKESKESNGGSIKYTYKVYTNLESFYEDKIRSSPLKILKYLNKFKKSLLTNSKEPFANVTFLKNASEYEGFT